MRGPASAGSTPLTVEQSLGPTSLSVSQPALVVHHCANACWWFASIRPLPVELGLENRSRAGPTCELGQQCNANSRTARNCRLAQGLDNGEEMVALGGRLFTVLGLEVNFGRLPQAGQLR